MNRRRLPAALLAVYSVVVASGAPLPFAEIVTWVTPISEQAAQRFPCEACPCGCGTAEHCWNACCCHTLAQRLAWARREGVRPPDTALDDAVRAGLDIRDWRPLTRYTVRVTAEPSEETPIDSSEENEATQQASLPPCCRKQAGCCQAPPATESPQAKPANRRSKPGVALLRAMACQGLAEAWLSLGQAPLVNGPELITDEVVFFAIEPPAPLWCHVDEAPTPPPPDGTNGFVS